MRLVGITRVRRAFLGKVAMLYVVLTVIAVTLPALATKPRGTLPHPTHQEARRSAPGGAEPVASRR